MGLSVSVLGSRLAVGVEVEDIDSLDGSSAVEMEIVIYRCRGVDVCAATWIITPIFKKSAFWCLMSISIVVWKGGWGLAHSLWNMLPYGVE